MSGDEDEQSRVLASVRRILGEDAAHAEGRKPEGGIFQLDPSMMIERADSAAHPHPKAATPAPGAAGHDGAPEEEEAPAPVPVVEPAGSANPGTPAPFVPPPAETGSPAQEPSTGQHHVADAFDRRSLIAGHAAEAAGNAFGSLRHAMREQRAALATHRGGPTIEELIREEIRPLLKAWIDAHLPPLVERVIQAEISRIAERDAG